MSKTSLLIAAILSVPVSAVGQAGQSGCTPPGFDGQESMTVRRTGVGAYTLTATVKADLVTRDGKETTGGVTTAFQARDSQGRTRVEQPMHCFMDKNGQSHWEGAIDVIDPVAGTSMSWRVFLSGAKTAMTGRLTTPYKVDPLPVKDEIDMALMASQYSAQDPDREKHIQTKAEDLGNRMIDGLEAHGLRITTTYPAGILNNTADAGLPANQRPIVEVEERWISEDYRVILLDNKDSSLFGKSSYEVTSFKMGEPDPALFQPPPEYSADSR